MFEVAARHASFQAAAAELHVTPAAVSHQIKRLEDYLHRPLFERGNRSVTLTAAGEALAPTLQTLFVELEDALRRVASPDEPRIRVSTLASLAAKWLVPRLRRFQQRHPHIGVRVETSDQHVNFASEAIDIAIRYGSGRYRGLQVEPLMAADVFPVCSPELLQQPNRSLRQPDDLRRHTLLHDESAIGRRGVPDWAQWLRAAQATRVDGTRGPVFASIHLAQEAALAGHGVALGVAPLVREDLRRGRLVRPFELALGNAYAFWTVCHHARADDRALQLFRRWLVEEAADDADRAVVA